MTTKDYITTRAGTQFSLSKMNVEDVDITDIAHALSMNCRFNGHVDRFYSVAQHCVIVSFAVPPEYAFEGLMHDASEAFIPDMPRPFKQHIDGMDKYEDELMSRLAAFHGFRYPLPDDVRYVDHMIVGDEARALYASVPDWVNDYEPVVSAQCFDQCWSPKQARFEFLDRYWHLRHSFARMTR